MRRGLLAHGMSPSDIATWEEYHAKYPNVWHQVELLFLMRVHSGARRIGVKKLFEDLRDNPEIQKQAGDEFKLNNNFTSAYARALLTKWPEYSELVELRRLAA